MPSTDQWFQDAKNNKWMFQPILKNYQRRKDYGSVDLSKSALEDLQLDPREHDVLSNYLDEVRSEKKVSILYGGYLERRSLYNNKALFQNKTKRRNIHLGIDFWAEADEDVVCPFDGVIHSFADNRGVGNYGPCVILKHQNHKGTFYSLYGHLNRKSLKGIQVGQSIKQNQVFCHLGNTEENGGYVPHLHFQIIKDIQDYTGDYPGVCHKNHLEYYKNNTVNPVDFLDLLI